ncbi:hypothetical protein R533_23420 [Salmonella enterica subsp. houtenae serovar 40:z4,z32:-]|uniref:Uncharacterized protein n=2 Tax=Salmonella enterica TaxID=28901 RepID=A0A704VBK5_SALER|nr:hypothetical protein [Salmonella enterica subsp. houtenae]EAM4411825.1 hypothetical protein [Salmonella enterica]OSD37253.1 hypothetical protein R533_23420 [Salmonella enterica subsp. houtenae serovar 40:z4,z32:-]HAC6494126.1 hypothetical protein [Salmonella enterica subsp. houtenae serovar 44:z36[z38]:-]EAP0001397.1 hypothetical protein [Salmonella enterica]
MIFKMLLGVMAFLLFSYMSVMLNDDFQFTRLSTISFLVGCYLFLYFFVFSLIDASVKNVVSFHQRYNQENIRKPFLKGFIGGEELVSKGYKLAFNLGFLVVAYFMLKNEM